MILNFADKILYHTDLYSSNFWDRYTFVISKSKKIMTKESFHVTGENLLKKVKELIAEGNVRKITILDRNDKELASFPLVFGIVGVLIMPVLVAVGAIAAVVGECKILVERDETKEEPVAEHTL
jgi:CBS domain-containing protein